MSPNGPAADALVSRFFDESDPSCERLVLDLPRHWWSRPYEYEWCRRFVSRTDTVLDAGCGISHPFKFYLADTCQQAHACDADGRIVDDASVRLDVASDFGQESAGRLSDERLQRVTRRHARLERLPYTDGMFDKVFCISVLDQMDRSALPSAFREMRRVLKPEGHAVLTFPVPLLSPAFVLETAFQTSLTPAGPISTTLPRAALYSALSRLYIYRVVLQRAA